MRVEFTVGGHGSFDELKNLEDWLLEDPGLAGCPITRPPSSPAPGEMGALSDVLVVALGSGGAGATLASSLSVWLRTRVGDVTLRVRTPRGEAELTARNAKDAEAVIASVSSLLSHSDPGSS
jgi:hypothetical protein